MENFDKENIYDNEISQLITQIIAICNEHKIPMLASFVYENLEEDSEGMCTTLINNHEGRYSARFQKAANVIRGSCGESVAITTVMSAAMGEL